MKMPSWIGEGEVVERELGEKGGSSQGSFGEKRKQMK
jgi:hypothetical protein